MTISDAMPVQFWLTDCETFNEKEVPGINHACWCQPFQCDDEINLQFIDTVQDISLPSLSTWLSEPISSPSEPWTTGVDEPSVTVDGESSELLYTDFAFEDGVSYRVRVDFDLSNPGVFGQCSLRVTDDSFSTQFSTTDLSPGGFIELEFTANATSTKVGFRFTSSLGATTVTVTAGSVSNRDYTLSVLDPAGQQLESIEFEEASLGDNKFLYSLSFVPENYHICNERIAFKIFNGETEIAKSDCLHIKESHAGTQLIEYYNGRNFAGLIYEDLSPTPSFSLRVPAVFYHKRFPQESRAIERTSSTIVTSSKLKKQRLLQVEHVPQYFHEKIILALSHHSVEIDGKQWKKEEGYEMDEGNPHYPLKKATVYLTEKNFLARNVL